MAFTVTNVPNDKAKSQEANEYLTNLLAVISNGVFLSELPLPNTLKIRPFYGFCDACSFLSGILDFPARRDDVFVCSTPKSGTSWVHSIVWLLTHDLDYHTIRTVDRNHLLASFNSSNGLNHRVEQLMFDKSLDRESASKMAWNEHFGAFESPRVIKTFFPSIFCRKMFGPITTNWSMCIKMWRMRPFPKVTICVFII